MDASKAQLGEQQIRIRAMVDGRINFLRLTTTVEDADVSGVKSGNGASEILLSIEPAGTSAAAGSDIGQALTVSVEPSSNAGLSRVPQSGGAAIQISNSHPVGNVPVGSRRSDHRYSGTDGRRSVQGAAIDVVIEGSPGTRAGEGTLAAALEGSPASQVLTAEEIGRQCSDAVVVLEGRESSGSGFFITSDGYILTCAHVLPSDGNELAVRYRCLGAQETTYRVRLVRMDRAQDLALLKIDPVGPITTVRLDLKTPPAMGEVVSIIGNPGLGRTILEYTMTQGIVSSPRRELEDTAFVQTSAPVNPGSSGSPAINARGAAFGVVVAKATLAEGVGFVVAPDHVAEFLRRCLRY